MQKRNRWQVRINMPLDILPIPQSCQPMQLHQPLIEPIIYTEHALPPLICQHGGGLHQTKQSLYSVQPPPLGQVSCQRPVGS